MEVGYDWKVLDGLPHVFSSECCVLRYTDASPHGLSSSNKLDQLSYLVVLGHCSERTKTSWQALKLHIVTSATFSWSKQFTVTTPISWVEKQTLPMRDITKNYGKKINLLQSTLWSQLFSFLSQAKHTPS